MVNEYAQRMRWCPPNFTTIRLGGPDHAPKYGCTGSVNGVLYKSEKSFNNTADAKKNIAKKICVKLGLIRKFPKTTTVSQPSPIHHNDDSRRSRPAAKTSSMTGSSGMLIGYDDEASEAYDESNEHVISSSSSGVAPSTGQEPKMMIFWDMDYQSHLPDRILDMIDQYEIHAFASSYPGSQNDVPQSVSLHYAPDRNSVMLNNTLHISMMMGMMAEKMTDKWIGLIMEKYHANLLAKLVKIRHRQVGWVTIDP